MGIVGLHVLLNISEFLLELVPFINNKFTLAFQKLFLLRRVTKRKQLATTTTLKNDNKEAPRKMLKVIFTISSGLVIS